MRTLVESALYSHNIARFSSVERSDEAMLGITWAISSLAEDFPIVPKTTALRLAKTEKMKTAGKVVRLRVWFSIRDEQTVDLLAADSIEAV